MEINEIQKKTCPECGEELFIQFFASRSNKCKKCAGKRSVENRKKYRGFPTGEGKRAFNTWYR